MHKFPTNRLNQVPPILLMMASLQLPTYRLVDCRSARLALRTYLDKGIQVTATSHR